MRFKNILLFVLSLLTLNSCETIIDIEMPPYTSELVANCFFTPDSAFKVHVSHSLGVLDEGNLNGIENAKVEILENGQVMDILTHTGNGFYRTKIVYPSPGNTYSLKVEVSGYESIIASDIIPAPVSIVSVAMKDSVFTGQYAGEEEITYAELSIKFNDPQGEENYYAVDLYLEYSGGTINNIWLTSIDPAVDGVSEGNKILFSDALFEGQAYELKVYFDSKILTLWNQTLYLKFISTSKAYYLYEKSLDLHQLNQDNPFAEPVQVHNNIENGLGIFAGFSVVTIGL